VAIDSLIPQIEFVPPSWLPPRVRGWLGDEQARIAWQDAYDARQLERAQRRQERDAERIEKSLKRGLKREVRAAGKAIRRQPAVVPEPQWHVEQARALRHHNCEYVRG